MARYVYKCKGCGQRFETDSLAKGSQFAHMREDTPVVGDVCGEVVRDWKAEGVSMARVPGGARG